MFRYFIFLSLACLPLNSGAIAQTTEEKASALRFFDALVAARLSNEGDAFSIAHTPDSVLLSYGLEKSAAAMRTRLLLRNRAPDAEFETTKAQIDSSTARFGTVDGHPWAAIPLQTVIRSKASKTTKESCILVAIYQDRGEWFFLARDKGRIHPALLTEFPGFAKIKLPDEVTCQKVGS